MEQITKQKLNQKKDNIGLVGIKLDITDDTPGKSLSASIQQDWKRIRIDYQKDLDLIPDAQTDSFCRRTEIDNPELKVGEDLLYHECGHRELPARTTFGCPFDVETHDRIKSEVARALKEKGKEGQTDYVTNAFEDVLDNINDRNYTDFAGQTLFWNNQGLTRSQNGKYNPFYEAFVRTNLFLGREVKSHTLLSRFFSTDERVLPAVKGFLEGLCTLTGEQASIGFNKREGFKRLFTRDLQQRRKLWADLGYLFASQTADLLDENSGGGSGGDSNGSNSGGEEMFGGKENPFDGEMKDPQTQEKIAKGRYQSGEGPSYHADLQEQLYSLYKSISKDIQIQTSTFTASQSMPLVHYGKRFATEDDRRIRFRGVGVDAEGKLGIRTARHQLEFPASYRTHPTQFPNLKIAVMDRSGSMAQSPDNDGNIGDTSFIPWGDRSKYHFALKGYFGIDNFLERQGVSDFMDCSVIGLSGESTIRGKSKEVAKQLLHAPKGNYTTLDASKLENELSETALVISISDGAVSMPSNTSGLDARLAKCDYVHIQIGDETPYCTYVRSLGKHVIPVKGDDDLSRVMVNFVSNYYSQKAREAKR